MLAERLRPLFKHDLALAAYHIPLDAHPEVGNNAILANALGCERHEAVRRLPRPRDRPRRDASPGDGVAAGELFARVREVTGREPLVQGAGPERVRRIGIVSGSAADALDEAIDLGLDAFLTGEPREHVMADAREPASTSSPPATTRRRRSASARWATGWPSASGSSTSSWTSRTRSERPSGRRETMFSSD